MSVKGFECENILSCGKVTHMDLEDGWSAIFSLGNVLSTLLEIKKFFKSPRIFSERVSMQFEATEMSLEHFVHDIHSHACAKYPQQTGGKVEWG